MITKDIQKSSPTSSFVKGLINNVMGHRPYSPPAMLLGPPRSHTPLHKTWDKITYTRWIEGVKAKFKKGDLVTHKKNPTIIGFCPLPYEVMDIQELHYEAIMDLEKNVPCALYVRILDTSVPRWANPEDFRLLTEDEIDAYKKSEQSKAP